MDPHKDSEVGSETPELQRIGEGMGFRHVEAGPLVRRSYHAERQVPRMTEPLRTRAEVMAAVRRTLYLEA